MLPLAIGMPVALTDHLDRSDKQLLRGRTGSVHSMDWPDDATQPNVVWVKFDESDNWTLPGTSEPGLYPIIPAKKGWFLDQGRKKEKMLQ
eukprot:1253538-Amphidinium_carterae.1